MAKGLKEIMEPQQWTLQEELLLAHAVVRFGLEDWKTVSENLGFQVHNVGRIDFSPEVCQTQFNLLHARCGIQASEPEGVVGSISKMLREQRLSELRSGLSRRESAISLLKAKISNLEHERLRLNASANQTEVDGKQSLPQLNYDPPADHQANGQVEKGVLDSPSTPAVSLWGEGLILMPTLSQEMASWLASGDAPLLTDEAEVLDASPQGTSEALKGGASRALSPSPLGASETVNGGTSKALNGEASKPLEGGASEVLNGGPSETLDVSPLGAPEALNAPPLGPSEGLVASSQGASEALNAFPGGASEALIATPQVSDAEGQPSGLNVDIEEQLTPEEKSAQVADVSKSDVSATITPTSLLEGHALDARAENASANHIRAENDRAVNEASSEEDVPIASFKKSLPEAKARVESPRQEESALDALADIYRAEEMQPDVQRVYPPTVGEKEAPTDPEESPVEQSLQNQASADERVLETAQESPTTLPEVDAKAPKEDASQLEGPEIADKSGDELQPESALSEPLLATRGEEKEGNSLPEKRDDSQEQAGAGLTLPETAQAEEAVEGAAGVKAGEDAVTETQDGSLKGSENAEQRGEGERKEAGESVEKHSEAPESKLEPREAESGDVERTEDAGALNDAPPETLAPLNERLASPAMIEKANIPEESGQEERAVHETERQQVEPQSEVQAKEESQTVATRKSSPEAKVAAVESVPQAAENVFEQLTGEEKKEEDKTEEVASREESEREVVQDGIVSGNDLLNLEKDEVEPLPKVVEVEKEEGENGGPQDREEDSHIGKEEASAEARESNSVKEKVADKEVSKLQEEWSLVDTSVNAEELDRRANEEGNAADSEAAQEKKGSQRRGEELREAEHLEAPNEQGLEAALSEAEVNDKLGEGLREPARDQQGSDDAAGDLQGLGSNLTEAAAYQQGLVIGLAKGALNQQGLGDDLTAPQLALETESQLQEPLEANQSLEESVSQPTVDKKTADAFEPEKTIPQGGLDLNLRASDDLIAPESDVSKPVIDLNVEPQEGPVTSLDGLAVLEDGSLLSRKGTLEFEQKGIESKSLQNAEDSAEEQNGKSNEIPQEEERRENESPLEGKETDARNESDGPMHSAQDSLLGGVDVTSPSGAESKIVQEAPHIDEKQAPEMMIEEEHERMQNAALESGKEERSVHVRNVGQEEKVKQGRVEASPSEKGAVLENEGEKGNEDGAARHKRKSEEFEEMQAGKRAKIEDEQIDAGVNVSEQKESEGILGAETKSDGEESDVVFEGEEKSSTPRAKVLKGTALARAVKAKRAADKKAQEGELEIEGEESDTQEEEAKRDSENARVGRKKKAKTANRKAQDSGDAEEVESEGEESDTQEEEKRRPESAGVGKEKKANTANRKAQKVKNVEELVIERNESDTQEEEKKRPESGKKKKANTAPARAALAAKLLKQAQLRAAKETTRQQSPNDVADDVSIEDEDVSNQDPASPPVEYDEDLTGGSEEVEIGGGDENEKEEQKEEASWQRKHLKIDTQEGQSEGESSPVERGSKSANRRGGSRPQPGGVMALCKEVVLNLSAHRAGHLFRDIDYTTFPGDEKIKRQVDLHIIRQNVDTGVYDAEGSKGFYRDIQTMVDNVTSSFEPGTNEHVAALALRTFADEEMALVWKTEEMIRDGARSSRRPPPKFEPIIMPARKSPLGREESPFSAGEEVGKNARGKSRLGGTPEGEKSKRAGKGKNATPKGEEPTKSKAASKAKGASKAEQETPRNETKSKASKPSPKTEPKAASKSNKQKAVPKSEPPKKAGGSKEKGKGVKRPPEPSPEPEKKKGGKKARR